MTTLRGYAMRRGGQRGAMMVSWLIAAGIAITVAGAMAVGLVVGLPALITVLPENFQTWCNATFLYTANFMSWTALSACVSFELGLRIALYSARWVLRLLPKPLGVSSK